MNKSKHQYVCYKLNHNDKKIIDQNVTFNNKIQFYFPAQHQKMSFKFANKFSYCLQVVIVLVISTLHENFHSLKVLMRKENQQSRTSLQCEKRCQFQCQSHKLVLRNLIFLDLNCQVMFCPKYNKQKSHLQDRFPVFSNDKKFYTSSFILQIDRETLLKNQPLQKQQYLRQVNKLKKFTKLLFPKPSNKFCMICKSAYENYFQHISSQDHISLIEANLFTKQIRLLSQKFHNLNPKVFPQDSEEKIITPKAKENQNKDENNTSLQQEQQSQDAQKHQGLFSKNGQDSESLNQTDQLLKNIGQFQLAQQIVNISQFSIKQDNIKEQNIEEDSVEIIGVKPAKVARNANKKQKSQSKQKTYKRKKKQKKIKKKKRKYKSKQKKKKKTNSKNKYKQKHKKSRKKLKEKRKKSKINIQIDSPPITSPLIQNKMAIRAGSKAVHPPLRKQQLVLIQKNQIEDIQLDLANKKILENIVATINKGPPPQPPRQYRKAGSSIDLTMRPIVRINKNLNSYDSLGQKGGNRQILSSEQILIDELKNTITTDKSFTIFLNKPSISNINQQKQSKNSDKFTSQLLNFKNITEKPDWQKLKKNLISSNQKGKKQQNLSLTVISLDDGQSKQSQAGTFTKNKIHQNKQLQKFTQKKQSNPHNLDQNQNKLMKSMFNFEYNLPFDKEQTASTFKTGNHFQLKNSRVQMNNANKQLSLGISSRKNQRFKYSFKQTFPSQQKLIQLNHNRNKHLTRKICDKNHQQMNIAGVIDLEIDEISLTQAIIHRRQENFFSQPFLQNKRPIFQKIAQQENFISNDNQCDESESVHFE